MILVVPCNATIHASGAVYTECVSKRGILGIRPIVLYKKGYFLIQCHCSAMKWGYFQENVCKWVNGWVIYMMGGGGQGQPWDVTTFKDVPWLNWLIEHVGILVATSGLIVASRYDQHHLCYKTCLKIRQIIAIFGSDGAL